ncbi:MAG: hypothetical protein M3T96_02915, partial [Acidobacteriota bacterium]|nr:hypothetical protein [Acidobacteriota bacterium]
QAETPVVAETKAAKQSWAAWFGTDAAIRWVYLIFGFFAIILIMTLLQQSTQAICCGDWDGYYHIKWSSLLWENFKHGKWLPEFVWLPLTVLNAKDYADHHFLFHLLQIPFLWFFEPVMAAKIAAITYGSLAIFSAYWLMFRYKVDYLLIWLAALLTCASSFLFRINMAKAPPLTIIITVIGIYFLFQRRYVWLMPLMFVFVWTYSLFPLLLFAAFFWTLIIAWNERRFEWRPLAYTFGGMILGNVINPYFPQNLYLFYEHFVEKLKIGSDFVVPVGGEWYPYNGQELLLNFPIALIAMLVGYVLFAPKNGKLPEKSTFFLMFVSVLLVAQFRSKRFAEYFPPFAILFAAFSWRDFLTPLAGHLPENARRGLENYLDGENKPKHYGVYDVFKYIFIGLLGLFLVGWLFYNLVGVNFAGIQETGLIETLRGNEANDKYRRATDWAKANIPEGELIFNCNWDDFPKLFFYDTTHRYVYGLDPNYLYTTNPELSKLIPDITSGKIAEAAPLIREKFGSRWIFNDAKENEDMVAKCLESGWCEMAYQDDEAMYLKIRDVKGAPPNEADDAPATPEEQKQLDDEEANDAKDNQNINDNENDN